MLASSKNLPSPVFPIWSLLFPSAPTVPYILAGPNNSLFSEHYVFPAIAHAYPWLGLAFAPSLSSWVTLEGSLLELCCAVQWGMSGTYTHFLRFFDRDLFFSVPSWSYLSMLGFHSFLN